MNAAHPQAVDVSMSICIQGGAGHMDGLRREQPFSFVWLEERIVEYVQDTDDATMTWFERYAMIGVVAIGGLAILVYALLRNQLGLRMLQIGALLQWACVALVYIRIGYRAWRAYKRQYSDFARDLDDTYAPYRNIVAALRTCPYRDKGALS